MATTRRPAGDVELAGLVLSVLTFWLFGQTFLNLGPTIGAELRITPALVNVAVSLSALVCGMFIVLWGSVADRVGHVRIVQLGNVLGIAGALLVGLAVAGGVGTVMLLGGRVLMGLSTGAIMPAALTLINSRWDEAARPRAVSMFSIGTFGGMALSSAVGGLLAGTPAGWRLIFFLSAAVSVVAMLLVRRLPESEPATPPRPLDYPGAAALAVAMVAVNVAITQFGWLSGMLAVVAAVAAWLFWRRERGARFPMLDLRVFTNRTFTGAVLANFFLTATAGLIPVALWVLQGAGGLSVTASGYLTLGYAICLLLFIRAGEAALRRLGPRRPMLAGSAIVVVATLLLAATNLMQATYVIVAVIAFCLYGLGLALFATPTTATALGSLPAAMVGAGSGVFKMASSLGSALGVAIASTVFTLLQTSGSRVIGTVIEYSGRQDNAAVREAGTVGLLVVLVFAAAAVVTIAVTIRTSSRRPSESAAESS